MYREILNMATQHYREELVRIEFSENIVYIEEQHYFTHETKKGQKIKDYLVQSAI